jgi:multicomponent Na+:H+ antiporter subunit F
MNGFIFLLLGISILLTLLRLLRGPSLPDRVMALDLLGMVVAGIILATAAEYGQPGLLDIVLVFAVVGFFGTVALARYLEVRRLDDD